MRLRKISTPLKRASFTRIPKTSSPWGEGKCVPKLKVDLMKQAYIPVRSLAFVPMTMVLFVFANLAHAAPPRIGFVYPAGARAGTTIEAEFGGQYLGEPLGVMVSGKGVTVRIVDHNKLPAAAVIRDYRDKLKVIQPNLREVGQDANLSVTARRAKIERLLAEAELSEKKVRQIDQYTRERADLKRQLNSQIGESVYLRIKVEDDAEPGLRHCRLLTASGLSNPLRFVIGTLPEGNEPDPWSFDLPTYLGITTGFNAVQRQLSEKRTILPPATVNGRILPGEVDEFTFKASGGDQVVLSLQARNLIPYLADAVPGWFQAVISLHDPDGTELAFADDYRFDPDPVLFYKIPRDGEYRIRIHDSIYRGREDFVYRLTVGELPFLTGISPLGGKAGSEVDLALSGGNLTERELTRYPLPETPGIIEITAPGEAGLSNAVFFHVDDVPEGAEREENNRLGASNKVAVPGLINGVIDSPGDVDFYRVEAGGGRPLTAEIFARRLGSPLDANLTVYDGDGRQIAWNDDFDNPSAGLTTHHADARVTVKPPGGGLCFVRVADTQHRGGHAFRYRLKITQGSPAFALRATPSSLNARPGGTAQVTVHVVRLDGFEGPIRVELKDAPKGFTLNNATIPAGEDSAKISIGVPNRQTEMPAQIALHGTAEMKDPSALMFDVVPAEDMTQAFIRHHFVPVDALLVNVRRPPE